jgi:hypothetical protein
MAPSVAETWTPPVPSREVVEEEDIMAVEGVAARV